MLLTTKDAARYLGISASFLEKDRVHHGRIPFVKLGNKRAVRYRQEDLDAYVAQSTFQSTSEY